MNIVQYIIVRKDVEMSKGKMSAQVAHASVATVYPYMEDDEVTQWLNSDFTKIVLGVKNLNILNKYLTDLDKSGIIYKKIVDNGLTEIEPNTLTCVGIKPYYKSAIQPLLKGLQLYV